MVPRLLAIEHGEHRYLLSGNLDRDGGSGMRDS